MLGFRIKGQLVQVERCAADMYIVRNIPGVFDNRIAMGAVRDKELVQRFLNSYAGKVNSEAVDLLDVDFNDSLPAQENVCDGCIFWTSKGCDVIGKSKGKI